MALATTVQWDVRTTGSDTNGGGFDSSSSGTDYSQQDSPQVSYTDLVIGATNSQLTSAAHPFTSAHVGNIINITGGTGFTTGRYLVSSVSGSTATMDRGVGTASSTGGTGNLGGGLATVTTAASIMAGWNTVWVKTGTYTGPFAPGLNTPYALIGYGTTHGDNGAAPTITTSSNAANLISGTSAAWTLLENLNLSSTASSPADGVSSFNELHVVGCTFSGFNRAIYPGLIGGITVLVTDTSFSSCAYAVYFYAGGSLLLSHCRIYGMTSAGVSVASNGYAALALHHTIIAGGAIGIQLGAGLVPSTFSAIISNCSIANNSGDGIVAASNGGVYVQGSHVVVQDCILYGNGGYGVNLPSAVRWPFFSRNNGVGGNTSGNYRNFSSSLNDVALSASPFTSSTNFMLNSTAGGGALCKGAGYQWSS